MDKSTLHSDGFSLVELSIVLVILGLLVGGILTGQNLIRAAELRSVGTELDAYRTAVNLFRDKYFAAPGDIGNAIAFWDEAHITPATCATTEGAGTQTCNGDGDGQIEQTASVTGGTSNEMFRFWQHLANAGLITGTFTGVEGSDSQHAVGGVNTPLSKVGNLIWNIRYIGVDTNYYPSQHRKNLFMLGTQNTNGWPGGSGLMPEEMWNIDTKMDDGKPGTGRISTFGDADLDCVISADDPDTDYKLSLTTQGCSLFSILD